VLSISLSLIAVFIPLLLMGGIVGRVFREFSVTIAAAITVSAPGLAHAGTGDVLSLDSNKPGDARPHIPCDRGCFCCHVGGI
jgi:hypothetical protein